MIQDTQEYLQHWEKENNPFYPSEMRWDRLQVNRFLKDYKEQLILPIVIERLPIGTEIKLIDNEDFKGYTGELKITGHCIYMGKNVGHLVNGEGIFLMEDFVR